MTNLRVAIVSSRTPSIYMYLHSQLPRELTDHARLQPPLHLRMPNQCCKT
jgi:hypothetical protein